MLAAGVPGCDAGDHGLRLRIRHIEPYLIVLATGVEGLLPNRERRHRALHDSEGIHGKRHVDYEDWSALRRNRRRVRGSVIKDKETSVDRSSIARVGDVLDGVLEGVVGVVVVRRAGERHHSDDPDEDDEDDDASDDISSHFLPFDMH